MLCLSWNSRHWINYCQIIDSNCLSMALNFSMLLYLPHTSLLIKPPTEVTEETRGQSLSQTWKWNPSPLGWMFRQLQSTLSTCPPHMLCYLSLIAVLQGSQVPQEAHPQPTPPLSLRVLGQTVKQDSCVPCSGQQPQDFQLWKVLGLFEKRSLLGFAGKEKSRPINDSVDGDVGFWCVIKHHVWI